MTTGRHMDIRYICDSIYILTYMTTAHAVHTTSALLPYRVPEVSCAVNSATEESLRISDTKSNVIFEDCKQDTLNHTQNEKVKNISFPYLMNQIVSSYGEKGGEDKGA
ncbi:hypothetical protein E5288_WYG010217 [Bos mutus]|uniref:Uncharacterized protein n=1 Tax=Bos mutus TaxID=72004 RepID=A0A6B0RD93_9CETA|nr:hypothetical protein [Bos mutus]